LDPKHIAFGGDSDINDYYVEPTIMTDVSWDDDIMKEEIFGPILPVLTFENFGEVIPAVNQQNSPLALYLFTTNTSHEQQIIKNIQFGGGCINDTVSHFGNLELPFGGIGKSGFGSYHSKASFDTFSQQKSITKKANWLDIPLRYPPYKGKFKWLKKLSKFL
jgi:aldehyde dehydrogenase (NAD+)